MKNFIKDKKIHIVLSIFFIIILIFNPFSKEKDSNDTQHVPFYYENSFDGTNNDFREDSWKSEDVVFGSALNIAKSGVSSLRIEHEEQNDSRYVFSVKMRKDCIYKLSCWIKTEDVGLEETGANISIAQGTFYFGDLKGTNDWQFVDGYIRALSDKDTNVFLRLGGYSSENSGIAYFDDFKIEELKELPTGIDMNSVNVVGTSGFSDKQMIEWQYSIGYTILFFIIGFIFFVIYKSIKAPGSKPVFQGEYALFIIFAAAFAIRLFASPFARGFEGDVNLFKQWGNIMARDVFNFYENAMAEASLADYPPFYMYVLGFLSKLMNLFGIEVNTAAFRFVIKLPPMIADLVTAYYIYKICLFVSEKKNTWLKGNWLVFLPALYLFNPMVLLDSVVWGQMDSFLVMFMVIALYFVMKKKVIPAALFFAISITIKPQGFFAGPVLLYYVLFEGEIWDRVKNFAKVAVTMLVTTLLITLPYTLKNIMFLPNLILNTAGGYKYASVNAFNFFTLFGNNWVEDETNTMLGIPMADLGMIFLGVILLSGAILYYFLPKDYKAKPMLIGLYLVMGLFCFLNRMHERYLFPVLALALIVAIMDNSKFMMMIFALLTATSFFNSLLILQRYCSGQNIYEFGEYQLVYYVSAANIAAFALIVFYIIKRIRSLKDETISGGVCDEV